MDLLVVDKPSRKEASMGKIKNASTLKDKLDRVFSEFIRLRDADNNGYCRCISCGKIVHWREADCGHFVNRSHMGTRFSERNCNAQCRSCNRYDEGNNIGYTRGLINRYGIKVINDLEVKKNFLCKLAEFDYEIMIKDYKKRIKDIRIQKGISD